MRSPRRPLRSLAQIKELPVLLRRELSVYYLPASLWARDRLVAAGVRRLGDVQDEPSCTACMEEHDRESVSRFMAEIGLSEGALK